MTVSTLALVGNGSNVLDPSTWHGASVQSITNPETPAGVLDALASVPVVAEALMAHRAAADAAMAATDKGAGESAIYADSLAIYALAVRSGATKIPKRPAETEAVERLLGLWAAHEVATTATRRTARALDAVVLTAAAQGRSQALATALSSASAARTAVAEAEASVAAARDNFEILQALDVLTVRASGIPHGDAAHVVGDRTDRLSSHNLATALRDRIPSPEPLDAVAEPALQAHTAATRAAEVQRQARIRYAEIVPIHSGGSA